MAHDGKIADVPLLQYLHTVNQIRQRSRENSQKLFTRISSPPNMKAVFLMKTPRYRSRFEGQCLHKYSAYFLDLYYVGQ